MSDSAICDGLAADVAAHAAALAEDGGERSVTTGARLIRRFDAGCAVISESGVVLYAEQP